ncbi:MAG: Fe-S cluster assembly protein SufD, partial [Chloroflexi bacterium]|nr:Fe-S cluster assembly protein SufD [Chloroflexota bacterium]
MTVKEQSITPLSGTTALTTSERFQEPEWLKLAREAAWETFAAMPWPNYNEETWRRTRLTGFKLENFPLATAEVAPFPSREALPPELLTTLNQIESAGALVFKDGNLVYAELASELQEKGV